jgi:hypothetical protein
MRDREERDDRRNLLPDPRLHVRGVQVRDHVAGFVGAEAYGGSCQERSNLFPR